MNEPPGLGAGTVHDAGARGGQIGDGNTQNNYFYGPVALGGAPSGAGLAGTRCGPWWVFLSHTGELSDYPVGGSFVAAAKRAVERVGHALVEISVWWEE